jgi:hypothetical protein
LHTPASVTRLRPTLNSTGGALALRVGGEDRVGEQQRVLEAVAEVLAGLEDAALDLLHRHEVADDAGGRRQHLPILAARDAGGELAHPPGVLVALAAGAGVGVARVHHHGADPPARLGQVLAADLHRRGDTVFGREHRRRRRRGAVQISRPTSGRVLGLDAGVTPVARNPAGESRWRSAMACGASFRASAVRGGNLSKAPSVGVQSMS